jgi:hypothetical protein
MKMINLSRMKKRDEHDYVYYGAGGLCNGSKENKRIPG